MPPLSMQTNPQTMELAFRPSTCSSSRPLSMKLQTMSSLTRNFHNHLNSTPLSTRLKCHHAHPTSFCSVPLKRSECQSKSTNKPRNRRLLPRCTKTSSGIGGQDFHVLMRFIRLQSAIRNRSIKELFELICDECQYYFKSLPPFQPLQLTKKLSALLLSTMAGNSVQFVIKPTKEDGADFGIRWRLEWKENHLPLGLGCSLYTSHVYDGMIFVRKVKNIIEPLLHMEPLRLKLEEIFLPVIDKIAPKGIIAGKRRTAFMYCLLSLVFMITFLLSLKGTFV